MQDEETIIKRRNLKEHHENAVLENFSKYLKAHGISIEICCNPDPPDAIVLINGKKSWIEITDAYLNNALAESITSSIAADKKYKPVPFKERVILEPQKQYENTLISRIQKKYSLMEKIYEKYGSGILLVGIQNPFTSAEAISSNGIDVSRIEGKTKIFHEIYYYDTSGSAFFNANIK